MALTIFSTFMFIFMMSIFKDFLTVSDVVNFIDTFSDLLGLLPSTKLVPQIKER